MRSDKDIEDTFNRQLDAYKRVVGDGARVIDRGEAHIVYVPPTPKLVIITKDGKRIEHARLPDNEKNDDWDERIIAGYINTRLSGESKQ